MEPAGDTNLDVETTVPTDLTVSSYSDNGSKKKTDKKGLESYFRERKQLLREVQLLNIELARKNAVISSLQGELTVSNEEHREKLQSVLHEKQVIQTKLQTQLRLTEEENALKTNVLKREMNYLKAKNDELESTFENVKRSLGNLVFSEAEVFKLRVQSPENLSPWDFIRLKVGENMMILQKENQELQSTVAKLEKHVESLLEKLSTCETECQKDKEEYSHTKGKCEVLLKKLNTLQSHVDHSTYAQENFCRVKTERDKLRDEVLKVKKSMDEMRAELLQLQQERDRTKEELIRTKQNHAVLQKECENLSFQLSDVTQKWGECQDKSAHLQTELNMEKLTREEMLQRFATSRDRIREQFEEYLESERNRVRSELIQLHEKEIRSLTESRSAALRQKETTEAAMLELRIKYEHLYTEFRETSAHGSVELKNLKKQFEDIKAELVKKSASLEFVQAENQEKLNEWNKANIKLQLTEEQLTTVKKNSEEKLQHLENELTASRARLQIYEDLESELNEVVNEAAQVEGPNSEEVIEKIASEMPIPANARYSFMRCVNLTRKVMQLERNLLLLQSTLNGERSKSLKLSEELSRANELLKQVQQPYAYLISAVKTSELHTEELKSQITELKQHIAVLKEDRDRLLAERNTLVADMNQVLEDRTELTRIRQELDRFQNLTTESLPSKK